jgi:hypothetical protein
LRQSTELRRDKAPIAGADDGSRGSADACCVIDGGSQRYSLRTPISNKISSSGERGQVGSGPRDTRLTAANRGSGNAAMRPPLIYSDRFIRSD